MIKYFNKKKQYTISLLLFTIILVIDINRNYFTSSKSTSSTSSPPLALSPEAC